MDTLEQTLEAPAVKTVEERKVAFICSKGNLDMAYPALVMGWAALGNGIDVTIFFTFWGMDMINKDRVDHLEIPPIGNASMKMNMMGVPGYVGIPQFMGGLPGMTPFATKLMNDKMAGLGRSDRCANTWKCWWTAAPSCTPARCRWICLA